MGLNLALGFDYQGERITVLDCNVGPRRNDFLNFFFWLWALLCIEGTIKTNMKNKTVFIRGLMLSLYIATV